MRIQPTHLYLHGACTKNQVVAAEISLEKKMSKIQIRILGETNATQERSSAVPNSLMNMLCYASLHLNKKNKKSD